MKNMLLVMSTSGFFDSDQMLWDSTWERLDKWLPHLKNELFPEPPTEAPSIGASTDVNPVPDLPNDVTPLESQNVVHET